MTNVSIQPLWLTHFIEILLVLEFQLTKFVVGTFSYKAHFRPQISSNEGRVRVAVINDLNYFEVCEGTNSVDIYLEIQESS